MTAVATPALEVEKARTALRDAVDALTTAQVIDVEHDDGRRSHVVVPPLLTSLATEITQKSAPSGSFAPRSRPPLWIDAFSTLQAIDMVTGGSDTTRVEAVHAWGYGMANADPDQVVSAARLAEHWLAQVSEMLDPTPKRHARGVPCPSCGAVKVWDRVDHDNDEHHARPALRIDDAAAACVCSACGATWRIELWEHLRLVLEQQRSETLAVPSWQPTGRLQPHPDLVQCSARVVDHRYDGTRREGYEMRCPALLDVDLDCPNAENHQEP